MFVKGKSRLFRQVCRPAILPASAFVRYLSYWLLFGFADCESGKMGRETGG